MRYLSDVVFFQSPKRLDFTMNRILDKTDKGREEIATRKYHLAARSRTLLVLIDGKHSMEEILKQISGLGLNEQNVNELLDNGFVHDVESTRKRLSIPAETPTNAEPSTDIALPAMHIPNAGSILPPGENQFQALYNFYTSTIKNTIGLRGYGLQLKIERASSVDDFRNLRATYLEAVQKAKGSEMARSLRDRLDQLLSLSDDSSAEPAGKTISGA